MQHTVTIGDRFRANNKTSRYHGGVIEVTSAKVVAVPHADPFTLLITRVVFEEDGEVIEHEIEVRDKMFFDGLRDGEIVPIDDEG